MNPAAGGIFLYFYFCRSAEAMKYTYDYPRASLTVDAVVFRRKMEDCEVLLIRRGREPFKGQWALPGGFIEMDETLEQSVVRELEEETGLRLSGLQQLHAFSALDRDPRGRTISVVFWGFLEDERPVSAGDDASEAAWFSLKSLPELGFDHAQVIDMASRKCR
jgi:8-oxo-dGTP diphosphatase